MTGIAKNVTFDDLFVSSLNFKPPFEFPIDENYIESLTLDSARRWIADNIPEDIASVILGPEDIEYYQDGNHQPTDNPDYLSHPTG
jgi:hypothetical protein